MFVVVAYDIANARRLKRIAKVLERFGTRVQRSVFECELTERDVQRLIAEVRAEIRKRQDRVAVFRLCEACRPCADSANRGATVCPRDCHTGPLIV